MIRQRLFSTSAAAMTKKTKIGNLFKHQAELPSLPVPPLKQTLELYKSSITPYYPHGASDLAFIQYSKVIDEFAESPQGLELQARLETFASSKRNWLSEFWDNYAYLDYRDPVSPYVSYFFSHKDINSIVGKNQILKAAAIVKFVSEYASYIEHETLEPEVRRNAPFCMESFRWMFNNCRVPGETRDTNPVFTPDATNKFAVIISNGKFYKLHTENTGLAGLASLLAQIQAHSFKDGANTSPVGVLTSGNRDDWYKNYTELIKSPLNEISVREIHRSLFVLCLDEEAPKTLEAKSRNCWHGNGWNRWFDKPVQMFVTKNGSSGFLGEHSKMDGTPTLSLNDWLIKKFEKLSAADFTAEHAAAHGSGFEELRFEVSPAIQAAIETEQSKFNKRVNDLDIKVWQYHGLGKSDIKKFKVSPDGFIQMLMQLAYYKLTGQLRPTYEAASTRMYFAGRTETCRSVTPATLEFVKTWEDVSKTNAEKVKTFRAAVAAHGAYITKASQGYGVDRHLFGLNQILKSGESVPEIFENSMFKYSSYWYVSTSQLTSEEFNGYGWSPVVPEGVGLAYMVNNEWLHVNVTAYKDNVLNIKVDELAQCLNQAAQELKEALIKDSVTAKL